MQKFRIFLIKSNNNQLNESKTDITIYNLIYTNKLVEPALYDYDGRAIRYTRDL